MKPVAQRGKLAFLALLAALAGCGDDGHGKGDPPAISSLAYVLTRCREYRQQGMLFEQKLLLRRGEAEPVVLAEVRRFGPTNVGGLCTLFGRVQFGGASAWVGAFQRLGMSPDGSILVFEVTDDHSVADRNQVSPEQEGIWVVRTDGSGLRRIADASRSPSFRADFGTRIIETDPSFSFNRDGSKVTFTDMGPGPGGDAPQIFIMDVSTGKRDRVTRLPPTSDLEDGRLPTNWPSFLDDETIVFQSFANPIIDGEALNPEGKRRLFTAKVNPDEPNQLRVVPFLAEDGGRIIEAFQITGPEPAARTLYVQGKPENGIGFAGNVIAEAFVLDSKRVLQLTNFERSETVNAQMSVDRQRIIFYASTNELGSNPFENCQIFSIDRNGADLRQLTNFDEGQSSLRGCYGSPPDWTGPSQAPGCLIQLAGQSIGQDPLTRSILFVSTCDPFGTNPNGSQIFSIRPDGTGLRQLTQAAGMSTASDGLVSVELPGPVAAPVLPR